MNQTHFDMAHNTSHVIRGLLCSLLLLVLSPSNAEESLELDGMAVVGNRELPKALFIVPWREAEAPLVPERPLHRVIDEALEPVDPEVFRRSLRYYDTVHNIP